MTDMNVPYEKAPAPTQEEIDPVLRLAEAVLFASAEPVTPAFLQSLLGEDADVPAVLETLRAHYAPRGVNLVSNDGSWSFRTDPALAPMMKITRATRRKLPKAASEVLAIIAYHQPVTRAEIESVRGVETSKGTLDILLEIGWIRPGKRRETLGRPLTWKTTPAFLSHFNLESLNDLPGLEDLKAAGLLDSRPILAALDGPMAKEDASDPDDESFANWVEEA